MIGHSPSAMRNRGPIFETLSPLIEPGERVLEIGSGTATHALHFCRQRSDIRWQPSEHPSMLAQLEQALVAAAAPDNIAAPLAIDVHARPWGLPETPSLVYTSNTLHMMPMSGVQALFEEAARLLADTGNGRLCVYGPMAIGGRHVSEGNRAFDRELRAAGDGRGIRDLDELNALAGHSGLVVAEVFEMPANNRLVAWSS